MEISDKLERFCGDGKEKELKKIVAWISFSKKNYFRIAYYAMFLSLIYVRELIEKRKTEDI